jgi:hypothetical protein
MSAANHTSKAELLAQKWFNTFNEHKMLFGFGSMLLLTICSIYFNMRLGRLNASPSDLTWWVMPASYSFLDIALLCIGMALFAGAIRGLLWAVSWAWFAFLLTLSLWACLSCIVALDAEKASTGDAFKRQQLERSLATANGNVDTWARNVSLTIKHKSRFQDRLDQAIAQRDDLINQISRLDSSTPPSQVIFEKAEAFLPAWMDANMFKTISRLIFGIAMVCTPLVLAAILAQVLGRSTNGSTPTDGRRKTVSPGENSENDSFRANQWQNFNNSPDTAPIRAEKAKSAHKQGRVAESATLNREALAKVRAWLAGEKGRITRQQIKYRSGNLNYENVSLIIDALLKEGWLNRMANGQLKAARPLLKAVI